MWVMSANPQLVRAAELHPACQDTTRHIADIGLALNQSMREHTVVLQLPGVQICAAPDLLAEIGPGAVAFPSAAQFASWVGVCPGQQESAGASYSTRSPKGNHYLRRLLCQLGWTALCSEGTFFCQSVRKAESQTGRQGSRLGHCSSTRARDLGAVCAAESITSSVSLHPRIRQRLRRKFQCLLAELPRAGIDPLRFAPNCPVHSLRRDFGECVRHNQNKNGSFRRSCRSFGESW